MSGQGSVQLIVAARQQEYAWSAEICSTPDDEAHGDFGVKISVRGSDAYAVAYLLASRLQAALCPALGVSAGHCSRDCQLPAGNSVHGHIHICCFLIVKLMELQVSAASQAEACCQLSDGGVCSKHVHKVWWAS